MGSFFTNVQVHVSGRDSVDIAPRRPVDIGL